MLEDFFSEPPILSEIVLAIHVLPSNCSLVHVNRPSSGFAMSCPSDDDRNYRFQNGPTLTVAENEIIFLPKSSTYTVEPGKNHVGCFAVNFQFAKETPRKPFVFKPRNVAAFQKCFTEAEIAWRKKRPDYREAIFADLYRIIAMMRTEGELGSLQKEKAEKIAPAIAKMKESFIYDGEITVAALANMCGMSEVYFRKIFHTVTGASPAEYLLSLRLSRAKELLSSGLYSVGEACQLSGFGDVSYFSRFFKSRERLSPSEYRKACAPFSAVNKDTLGQS